MKTLLVGDVHGCSAPLRALIATARADRVVLLGDIFAKGPDPAGVWALIQQHDISGIMGNHDARLLDVWGQAGSSAHHRCWRQLPDAARLWTAGLPLTLAEGDWVAVHAGVNPSLGVDGTTRKQLLTVRRWPDDVDPENPFWWQLYPKLWAGSGAPRRIFYGHDALRGVQAHGTTVGLDSGCVYGGELSGMILETGEVLQVPGNSP